MKINISVPGRPTRWMRPEQGRDGDGEPVRFNDRRGEDAKREIARLARNAYGLRRPSLGPVTLRFLFVFPIPKGWSVARRKAALEGRVWFTSDPDLDRLINLVQDALVGIAYIDDNQVVGYHPAPAKRYGSPARTEITVEALPVAEDEKSPGQLRLEAKLREVGWDRLLAPADTRRKRSKTERDEARARADADIVRAGGTPPRRRAVWRPRRRA